jgi:recombination protein RecA
MTSEWRDSIEKEFGKEVFLSGFQGEVLPTGSVVVDHLTGIGGIPLGFYTELFGGEGCGKTTLALSIIKQAIDRGKSVLYEDYETTVSDKRLVQLGIDPKVLKNYRVTPNTMEDGWMIKKRFCEDKKNHGGVIVVDSLAAMPPVSNTEKMQKLIGHAVVGSQATVMSVALNEMTRIFNQAQVAVIFINQERAHIDLIRGSSKGTPGGNAIRFYSALRLNLQARGSIKVTNKDPYEGDDKEIVVAVKIGVTVVKNKMAPSFRMGQMIIRMDEGIDNLTSLLVAAQKAGTIVQRGPYFELAEAYSGDSLGKKKLQGSAKLRAYFEESDSAREIMTKDVTEFLSRNVT